MKKFKLKKVIVSSLLAISVLTLVPISANADTWQKNQYGKWHLYDDNGKPKSGWQQCGSNWYYTDIIGVMLTNEYIDGYYLGEDGALTTSPAEGITKNGKVITPESVKATSNMYNKLLNEGWVKWWKDGSGWSGNCAYLRLPDRKDGGIYATECCIDSGVPKIKYVTTSQNYKEYTETSDKYADLTLDQYLKYKSEGKIGTFSYYASALGGGSSKYSTIIQEYIKNGSATSIDDTDNISSKPLSPEEITEKLKKQAEALSKKNKTQ